MLILAIVLKPLWWYLWLQQRVWQALLRGGSLSLWTSHHPANSPPSCPLIRAQSLFALFSVPINSSKTHRSVTFIYYREPREKNNHNNEYHRDYHHYYTRNYNNKSNVSGFVLCPGEQRLLLMETGSSPIVLVVRGIRRTLYIWGEKKAPRSQQHNVLRSVFTAEWCFALKWSDLVFICKSPVLRSTKCEFTSLNF